MKRIDGIDEYVFKIKSPVSIHSKRIKVKESTTYENRLRLYAKGTIEVIASHSEPFAWDGCTPKFIWKDIVLGTPDGVIDFRTDKPKTYYASLFHDALYQFAPRDQVTRKQADLIMLDEMNRVDFKLAKTYYFFIRVFGWYFWNKRSKML